jgi:hypothetical protein
VWGVVPATTDEVWYKAGLNILLTIVTLGFWRVFWTYRTHGDLKRYNGDGLGEWPGAILALFVLVVIYFTVPLEISKLYERDGRESPMSVWWGLWFLLPIVGSFIWYLKVQRVLNEFWVSKGAEPAA